MFPHLFDSPVPVIILFSQSQNLSTILFFFLRFFWCGPFLKFLIEFVTILLLFYVFWFFGHEACGILAPQPGIKPTPPALEGEVLTTGLPRKSQAPFLCVTWIKSNLNRIMWCQSLFKMPLCPPFLFIPLESTYLWATSIHTWNITKAP